MDTLFTKEHLWLRPEEEGWSLGLTAEGLKELGDISYVALPKVGETIDPEAPVFVVESTKAAYDLVFPRSVEIVEVNQELLSQLDRLKKDPQSVWFVKITLADEQEEPPIFLTAEEYRSYCTARSRA